MHYMLLNTPFDYAMPTLFRYFSSSVFLANSVLDTGHPVVRQVSRDLSCAWLKRACSVSLPLEQRDKVISACVTERGRNEHG